MGFVCSPASSRPPYAAFFLSFLLINSQIPFFLFFLDPYISDSVALAVVYREFIAGYLEPIGNLGIVRRRKLELLWALHDVSTDVPDNKVVRLGGLAGVKAIGPELKNIGIYFLARIARRCFCQRPTSDGSCFKTALRRVEDPARL